MGAYIGLYTNNPTAGQKDGTAVSEGGSQTSPINFSVTVKDGDEQTAAKCAIRCAAGYKTSGEVGMKAYFLNEDGSVSSDEVEIISFAEDENFINEEAAILNGKWTNSLTITNTIGDVNHIFWVKALAKKDTKPQKITNITIEYQAIIEAV